MTGYELTDKMRRIRRRYPLTSTEQALYLELLAICNEEHWSGTFTVSNGELCNALCISENTLEKARISLVQAQLIIYRSGKSRRQYGVYSFDINSTTSNFDTNVEVDNKTTSTSTSKFEVETATNVATNAEDYIKEKVKRKRKVKHSEAKASGPDKKQSSQKKDPVETTEHWQQLVAAWFAFYQDHHEGDKPTFDGAAQTGLEKIAGKLKKVNAEKSVNPWTAERAAQVMNHFLVKAWADQWRRGNFMLHILNSHFDAIIQTNENERTPKNNRSQGAKIDLRNAFGSIASMPD